MELTTTKESPAQETFTPTVFIDMPKGNLGSMEDVKVGDKVRVVLTGTIKSIAQQGDGGTEKSGSISVETKTVKVQNMGNAFSELMEGDDGA